MSSALPIVAIVGRPNVGKSTLFNRLAGRKIAIVHEQAGVTRDRVSAEAHWHGRPFEVIDTGGIAFEPGERVADPLTAATQKQAEIAIALADAIIFVVDVTAGVTPLDTEVATRLRRAGKPLFLAVNKADNQRRDRGADEFAALGFSPLYPIAAAHGTGVAELMAAVTRPFPAGEPPAAPGQSAPKLAIVGRPNVGKSSLVNAILGGERTIVSEVPGTTRDSVDVPFHLGEGADRRDYVLVDTAGLRHRRKIATSVDQFGLMRAERSIHQCDVAVLVLDGAEGITRQDQRIGGLIAEANCGCVILVNKWDLVEGAGESGDPRSAMVRGRETGAQQRSGTGRSLSFRAGEESASLPPAFDLQHRSLARLGMTARRRGGRKPPPSRREEFLARVRRELFFLDWAEVLFVSAKTGERVRDLFRVVDAVQRERTRRVETPRLNQLLRRALESYPPPRVGGKRLHILYAVQKPVTPPTFLLFVNDPACRSPHYERHLVDQLRATWGFGGCPVRLEWRGREPRERERRRKFTRK